MVRVGQRVLKGQLLAQADGALSASLHAPSSGVVTGIEARPVAHPSGLTATCIVIATDGLDEWGELPPPIVDYRNADPGVLRERVRAAGIVGLGGEAVPTHLKLNPGPAGCSELLLLNGAECEPYVTCDDMLMRERARYIIGGLLIMQRTLQAQAAIIAVADDKPAAYAALTAALASCNAEAIAIGTIPARYPIGEQSQLIRVFTGRETPGRGMPAESGMVCHNVATAAAIYVAVTEGRPLLSRYITVTGQGVRRPQVVEVMLGTPVAELIAGCGGYTTQFQRLLVGGPMRGFTLLDDAAPVSKGSNCMLAAGAEDLTPPAPIMPCIRCSACMDVCPVRLLPQQLYEHVRTRKLGKAQEDHLDDCIECGCCAVVCPSHIPLVQYFQFAQSELRAREQAKQQADLARRRYQARLARLEREQQEKEERLLRKETLPRMPAADQEALKQVIQAAVARARARKAAITAAAAAALPMVATEETGDK